MSKYKIPPFLRYLGRDDYKKKILFSANERINIQRIRTTRNKVYRYKLKVLVELLTLPIPNQRPPITHEI